MLKSFGKIFKSGGLAMDLGTANSLLYSPADGIIINEPSVVAIDSFTDKVIALGTEAKGYMGRTPKRIKVIRPIRDGVIADFEVTRQMISMFIKQASKKLRMMKPTLVICVPMGVTPVEKRAVIEAGLQSGARKVLLMEEPMAAAIGADLPIFDPVGNMVLDIGGGTSEVAIISLSSIAFSNSIRMAGDAFNQAIQRYFQNKFSLVIGENMAEEVKITIGSAVGFSQPREMDVFGKHVVSGSPTTVQATDRDVRMAIREQLNAIVTAVRNALEKTPPELVADVSERGLLMVGGGSLLNGLDQLISSEIQLKVRVDEAPLTTVVRGANEFFNRSEDLEEVLLR